MKNRVDNRRPELPYISDSLLIGALETLREFIQDDAHPETEFANIVEFELEAVRRGLRIDGPMEPTPPACALARYHARLDEHDLVGALNMLVFMDRHHLWIAYRRARTIDYQGARISLYCAILALVTIRLGEQATDQGRVAVERRVGHGMNDDDREAYLEQRILWLFGWAAGL